MTDLRDLVEAHLGKPLAASPNAGLWHCPACSPERHALLIVSADEYKCLSGYACEGGASEWMQPLEQQSDGIFPLGVPV